MTEQDQSRLNISTSSPATASSDPSANAMALMLQMQQQQLAMQEQMTQLMAKLIPGQQTQDPSNRQRVKLERPSIEADSSDNKWIIFTDAWTRYKQMAKLDTLVEIRNDLRSACSSSVNEMLFNFVGPDALNSASEAQLLAYIKSVAVKSIHPEVYRQQFFAMRQSDGESITCFISRLKSQAMLCDFKRNCDCNTDHCITSYSEDMIKSQVIAGLRNASHQNKILSEVSSFPTLQALTERLLILESTAKATSHFQPPTAPDYVAPIRSEYQRSKTIPRTPPSPQPPQPPTKDGNNGNRPPGRNQQKCRGCGRNRHQNGRQQCPAQGRQCNKCGKMNHFSNVCESSSANAVRDDSPDLQRDEDFSLLTSITTPMAPL